MIQICNPFKVIRIQFTTITDDIILTKHIKFNKFIIFTIYLLTI